MAEPPVACERAVILENTENVERAARKEEPVPSERAISREKPCRPGASRLSRETQD